MRNCGRRCHASLNSAWSSSSRTMVPVRPAFPLAGDESIRPVERETLETFTCALESTRITGVVYAQPTIIATAYLA